jgi:2'-5' RNA ligase
MGHRVFIAINLLEDVKKSLVSYEANWPDLPIRWTKKENLHITLFFLGYVNDEELPEICQIVKDAAARNKPFDINLKKIIYGPPNKKPPRMVWAEGEKSRELGKLQGDLENSLSNSLNKTEDKGRPYAPHITLGRIKTWDWKRIDLEEIPEVNEEINLSFEVNSVEIMESFLKRKGPDYAVLESCLLKD